MIVKLEQRIKDYLGEYENQHQEHCYASHHEDGREIVKDCLKVIETMKFIHGWCHINVENCTDVYSFCKEVRNVIEKLEL